jgi:hypothetical protein
METYAGQACGAGAYSRVGEVLQQALATTMLCSCGVLALWVWMLHILLSLGQVRVQCVALHESYEVGPALGTPKTGACYNSIMCGWCRTIAQCAGSLVQQRLLLSRFKACKTAGHSVPCRDPVVTTCSQLGMAVQQGTPACTLCGLPSTCI